MVIVVGNEKGGCGKTTVAVHLAAWAAREGRDVLLVDADPNQHSASRWAERRSEDQPGAPVVHTVRLTGRSLRAGLPDLAKRYAVVVVDTGAEDSPELRAAALAASVLVVPVQPEMLDLWTLPTMEVLAGKASEMNPGLRVILALNRVPYQMVARVPGEVGEWVAENVPGLPQPAACLVGRAAYGRATGEGLAVSEIQPADPKATAEVERLAQLVFAA